MPGRRATPASVPRCPPFIGSAVKRTLAEIVRPMTEEAWHLPSSVGVILYSLSYGHDRKLRCLAHAVCHEVGRLVAPALFTRYMTVLSEYIEGRHSIAVLYESQSVLGAEAKYLEKDSPVERGVRVLTEPVAAVRALAAALTPIYEPEHRRGVVTSAMGSLRHFLQVATRDGRLAHTTPVPTEQLLLRLVHEVFGNPFRPLTLDPRWRTQTVVALAAGIYEQRAFDRMPILADALEEAGCDNAEVLNHCRGDDPHVRGSWVVDLILAKE